MNARPKLVADVARAALRGGDYGLALSDFLHQFEADGRPRAALEVEPPFMRDHEPNGRINDAFLAGVAEYFCSIRLEESPDWCHRPGRFLREPWFALENTRLRIFLIAQTPAAFKRRNLFITPDSLSVA